MSRKCPKIICFRTAVSGVYEITLAITGIMDMACGAGDGIRTLSLFYHEEAGFKSLEKKFFKYLLAKSMIMSYKAAPYRGGRLYGEDIAV